MSKKKTTQTQTVNHQFLTPPSTPDMDAARETINSLKNKNNGVIPFSFATQREQLNNSYQNPLGSYTSPATREAVQRNAGKRLGIDQMQATNASQFENDNADVQRKLAIAAMTNPQLVNSGGTSTQTQEGGFWGDLLVSGSAGALA